MRFVRVVERRITATEKIHHRTDLWKSMSSLPKYHSLIEYRRSKGNLK